MTIPGVLAAMEAVFAAIKLIDSRYEDFRYQMPDGVCDNVGAAGVAFGSRARAPAELGDLWLTGCVFRSRERSWAWTPGRGHSAAAVASLIRSLAAWGERLPAGS